jgi:glycine cleavage system H protein
MSNPSNLKYTASHEWVKTEDDGTISIGITQHAQELLGDMVFVEAPAVGRKLRLRSSKHSGLRHASARSRALNT